MIGILRQKVRRILARKLQVPEIPLSLERLQSQGFNPTLIFDVGAYRGDFARECLRVWPSVEIACFEPLPHRLPDLRELQQESAQKISVYPCLLGASDQSEVVFHQVETASSVLVERENRNHPTAIYPMKTIDMLITEEFLGRTPDFLKLDVQGYELEVLKGADHALAKIQVVLAEVNLLDIHENVPLLAELVAWLNDQNFVAFDICGLTRRPLDKALWQADMVFIQRDSFLRSDKRWG